jgi:hypothetical protein
VNSNVLVEQGAPDLLITAGVLLVATLHWRSYPRPRPREERIVTVPAE